MLVEARSPEDDGEADFNDDKGQFGPKAKAQNAVLAEMDAKALIFGTYKDGTDDVAGDKEKEETVVEALVV